MSVCIVKQMHTLVQPKTIK